MAQHMRQGIVAYTWKLYYSKHHVSNITCVNIQETLSPTLKKIQILFTCNLPFNLLKEITAPRDSIT